MSWGRILRVCVLALRPLRKAEAASGWQEVTGSVLADLIPPIGALVLHRLGVPGGSAAALAFFSAGVAVLFAIAAHKLLSKLDQKPPNLTVKVQFSPAGGMRLIGPTGRAGRDFDVIQTRLVVSVNAPLLAVRARVVGLRARWPDAEQYDQAGFRPFDLPWDPLSQGKYEMDLRPTLPETLLFAWAKKADDPEFSLGSNQKGQDGYRGLTRPDWWYVDVDISDASGEIWPYTMQVGWGDRTAPPLAINVVAINPRAENTQGSQTT